jgi:hypothetical protein
MAIQTTTVLVDDMDGSEAADTYRFGLGDTWYVIDLSEENAQRLEEAFSPFLAAARKEGSQRRQKTAAEKPPTPKSDLSSIRAWAADNGYGVSERGRISKLIMDAYTAAHE